MWKGETAISSAAIRPARLPSRRRPSRKSRATAPMPNSTDGRRSIASVSGTNRIQ